MPKTDGYKTKEKILRVAEQLFAESGFNGVSIDRIAKAAGVNKGLIYYHFKDKKDIVVTIFKRILDELKTHILSSPSGDSALDADQYPAKIKDEIAYCRQHKNIIAVMLMEALKVDGNADFLFKFAEMVIQQEMDGIRKKNENPYSLTAEDNKRFLLYEFFTGFVPIISFVALQEKWCQYFGADAEQTLDDFIEAFTASHLNGHLK